MKNCVACGKESFSNTFNDGLCASCRYLKSHINIKTYQPFLGFDLSEGTNTWLTRYRRYKMKNLKALKSLVHPWRPLGRTKSLGIVGHCLDCGAPVHAYTGPWVNERRDMSKYQYFVACVNYDGYKIKSSDDYPSFHSDILLSGKSGCKNSEGLGYNDPIELEQIKWRL